MTTDTLPKAASRRVEIDGNTVTITGIAKGAGMIKPNMATMLGFVATDATVAQPLLDALVRDAADQSSTASPSTATRRPTTRFMLIATGAAGRADAGAPGRRRRCSRALVDVARELAQAIVRDGEGATKFITVRVERRPRGRGGRQIAYAIAHSPLVKTAFFASDPEPRPHPGGDRLRRRRRPRRRRLDLYLDDVRVAKDGGRNPDYQEADGQRVMKQSRDHVRVDLGRGDAATTVWTCDLSHDYVIINADYRS